MNSFGTSAGYFLLALGAIVLLTGVYVGVSKM